MTKPYYCLINWNGKKKPKLMKYRGTAHEMASEFHTNMPITSVPRNTDSDRNKIQLSLYYKSFYNNLYAAPP